MNSQLIGGCDMSEQNAETDLGAVMYSSRAMRRLEP